MAALCAEFQISRKTGYKWLDRFLEEGLPGLVDRRSAPKTAYQSTDPATVAAIVKARQRFPYWGPRKLKAWLERQEPKRRWPAASTIGELLKRHGCAARDKADAGSGEGDGISPGLQAQVSV